jgi:N-acetylglutamate synthase-like GNAT family acetyltransferase
MAKKEPLYPHKTPSQMKGIPPKPLIEKETTLADFGIPEIRVDLSSGKMEDWLHPAIAEEIDLDRASGEVEYSEIIAKMYLGKQKIGMVNYIWFPAFRIGYIEEIMVNRGYEKHGYGIQLLEYAIADMRKRGVTKVTADLLSRESEILFKKAGFLLKEARQSGEIENVSYAVMKI